jgi:ribosomal protein S18 acetylase RimI-like enzyme
VKTLWLAGEDRSEPGFREWLDLRQRVLREPLGLVYTAADLDAERDDRHLLALGDEGKVIGGLLVRGKSQPPGVWKIRQVAVEPTFQGRGIGRHLMTQIAREADAAGISTLVLHSRESVCGFYEKLGYRIEGEAFDEIGIPHRRMSLSR